MAFGKWLFIAGRAAQRSDLTNPCKGWEDFCIARGLATAGLEEIVGGINLGRMKCLAPMDVIESGTAETRVIAQIGQRHA